MTERDEAFRKIQAACAGYPELDVLSALLESVVVAIGVSAPSLPRAEAAIDALIPELKVTLRAKWGDIRVHRMKANVRRGTIADLTRGL